jgi:hypothetical protein
MYRGIHSLGYGLVVLLIVTVGCGRKIMPSVTTEVKDSIVIKEVPRYIFVDVPGDTVKVPPVVIECDPVTNKPKPFRTAVKSGRASASATLNDKGELTIVSACDSLHRIVQVMDKELYHFRHESKSEIKTTIEYRTRKIDIICRWISGAVVALIVAFVAFKYIKSQIPFLSWIRK